MIDVNRLPLEGQGGLMDLLKTIVDPRKPRGVRHPVATIVAIALVRPCPERAASAPLPNGLKHSAVRAAHAWLKTEDPALGTHHPPRAAALGCRPAGCAHRPMAGGSKPVSRPRPGR